MLQNVSACAAWRACAECCALGVPVAHPRCPQGSLHLSVTSSAAAAVVSVSSVPGAAGLPAKLNPVIQPLMGAVKKEKVSEGLEV